MRPSVSRLRALLQLRQQLVQKEDVLAATCTTRLKCCSGALRQRRSLSSKHGPSNSPPPPPSMALFQQQLQELQIEQQEISGINQQESGGAGVVLGQEQHQDAEQQHKLFQEQMEQLLAEREELFGFTHEEHSAWSNYGSNNNHSENWMQALQEARQQQEQQPAAQALVANDDDKKDIVLAFEKEEVVFSSSSRSQSLTHISADGASVHMVDVGLKEVTRRVAVAQSKVIFPPNVMQALQVANDLVGPKGPILATAKLAGIMAAKRTSDLIPLCHPLPLEQVHVDITLQGNVALITCECRVTHKTGVEMEALMGASIAALTIYDMVKAVSHQVVIEETRLVSKAGGKRNVVNDDGEHP